MTIRTRIKSVTFRKPFALGGLDEALPAGVYRVDTEEELLEGLSFLAYRRVSTLIHLHPKAGHPGRVLILAIDPQELDAALMLDLEPVDVGADPRTAPTKSVITNTHKKGQPNALKW